ncbi:GtrA family protein [Neobacillus sp. OS1-32]|jgi:putative flippase GtrA|uniref:GtrA family protein n=1 Tax=Neobacillus paridis TaxID=2803862 RepID=A0ABS1TNR1_9BACI|nr:MULTISPECIES: GtrA family protein [Neobacillus]MBL4952803.1 GtrA family protein [Neobacillus paridis]WML31673.1 GtrA family protein [Neobacillus sp. OS1-32]
MKFTFIRFILVGVANTIIGLSVMFLFYHLFGLSYWIATFLGNTIGACVSYCLNRSFTFNSRASVSKSVVRFACVILFCYFVSFSIGKQAVHLVLNHTHIFSAAMSTDLAIFVSTCFYTLLNYTLQKWIVFPQKSAKTPA